MPAHRPLRPVVDRLEKWVERTEACWPWRGYVGRTGYGFLSVEGRPTPAHRAAYEQWVGPIPDGLQIDHLCRNRTCCNPAHLEPVTQRENIRRGMGVSAVVARTNVCHRGHELTAENTGGKGNGRRYCKACAHLRYLQRIAKNEHYEPDVVDVEPDEVTK